MIWQALCPQAEAWFRFLKVQLCFCCCEEPVAKLPFNSSKPEAAVPNLWCDGFSIVRIGLLDAVATHSALAFVQCSLSFEIWVYWLMD